MKTGASRLFRRSVVLAAAGILALVLTACTGRGGGYLPPQEPVFTGQAAFGFTFSCENGDLKIELAYTDKGSNPIGSSFGIHGIVDHVDPLLESQFCIGKNPPPPPNPPNELTFLGRYWLTSGSPAMFPTTCPRQEKSTSPLCRFEVFVQDNDGNLAPSPGDFFSIKLSTVTSILTNDCPPGGTPPCVITELPTATVFYARAGYLAGGNIIVK
jgi:hypothetical protein